MNIEEFVQNFALQFEDTNVADFTSETEFRNIDEWSSLTSLSIMAMVDEEYDITLTGDDIRNSKTIQDIFELVKAKLN